MNPDQLTTALQAVLDALGAPATPSARPVPEGPPEAQFMTVAEFAARLGVCEKTVRDMLKAGMPHVRPTPRIIRVRVALAEKWLAEATNRGRAARAMKPCAVEAPPEKPLIA